MIRNIAALCMLMLFTCHFAVGQETIDDQFQKFYENNTSSWQEYKLVKTPKLQEFWKIASDTVRVKNEEIASLKSEITSLNGQISSLTAKLSTIEGELTLSETLNESITFIGIEMNKASYNVIVWLIIFILAVAVGVCYYMYTRSNRVTTLSRASLDALDEEFKEHKDNAREIQVKLKRELQTALNTIHENRLNH
ncbi:hypothetical protein SAMN04488028_10424 [Reichenbachiella agariperforans]|uniref:tRNA (Guanine-N1)-methyltransferase n=1 Tax=Reichenbachiella agariperforans TaxID=156994 RepID=A0A1M6R3J0_REIAG|nr:hypothetical protein [Reichenbachiella agariperforans]SHK26907.1 hypothetical protein SAMN04488028_10424 [Reichenbachiella agariperforans]